VNKNIGMGMVSLALLALLAFIATACGGETNAASSHASAASGVVVPAAPSARVNPGPAQVALGDGPAGVAGSRFNDPDVEIDLTADVVQWEVVDGEFVEVWVYNGQYPGPEIRVKVGDKVRINLTNNLPEATTIHWHGLEVPNDQDSVPGITQPDIPAGGSWTYEFVAPKAGTAMYHTHSNTLKQLTKGLFGAFIVEPREGLPQYDREYTILLHETNTKSG